jgi:hypothetical protein
MSQLKDRIEEILAKLHSDCAFVMNYPDGSSALLKNWLPEKDVHGSRYIFIPDECEGEQLKVRVCSLLGWLTSSSNVVDTSDGIEACLGTTIEKIEAFGKPMKLFRYFNKSYNNGEGQIDNILTFTNVLRSQKGALTE